MKKIAVLINLIFAASSVLAFESAADLFYVSSVYSGHEEITRQALNGIENKLKSIDLNNPLFEMSELTFDLLPEPKGLLGYKSQNMIIHGNFSSDFPNQTTVLDLAQFWNNANFSEFENADTQVIHFLKNYTSPTSLDSSLNTCVKARENIKYITQEAFKLWKQGNKTKALFLIGHATHTIQDSFSPAHAVRDTESNNSNILKVCFFGTKMRQNIYLIDPKYKNELCYHSPPDSRDAVWNISPTEYKLTLKNWNSEQTSQCNKNGNYPETESEKASCLKHEARLARVATEKYLFLVFNQLSPQNLTQKSTADFLTSMDTNLFDGPVGDADLDKKMPLGIMRCEGLSKDEIFGSEPQLH